MNLTCRISRSISNWLPLRLWPVSVSLRTQLIFWNIVALSLLLGGLGIVCRFVVFSFMLQSVDQELERGADRFVGPPATRLMRFGGGGPPPDGPFHHPPGEWGRSSRKFGSHPDDTGREGPRFSMPPHRANNQTPHGPPDADNPYRLHHFNALGRSEMPDDKRLPWDSGALASALRGETMYTTVMINDDPVRVLSAPGFTLTGKKGANQIAYPLKEVYRALSGIDTALLVLIPVGLLGAVWMGSGLTNRVLRPVHRMTQAAEHIGTGNFAEHFTRRLPVSGSDEFSELARTFNGLLGRLDKSFQEQQQILKQQQRFTADASHELKTPLTIVKGRAGLALSRASTDEKSRHAFREINAAADNMSLLVQDLLLLARSDEGQMGHDRKDLLVRKILESAGMQAQHEETKPIVLKIEPEEISILGNEAELVRLFRNLLDNAIRYTSGEEDITVTARVRQGKIVITVVDKGVGIAPEHLPHLGERFYRADASRTRPTGGTGLGLSICYGIVEAHGGTLSIESAPNIGTTVTVILPASSSTSTTNRYHDNGFA